MTPNKPETAKAAREMISMTNSALENNALILIGRLADTITYNAEAMNKLVSRVDELEKLVGQQSVPMKDQQVGENLENLLNDESVTQVKCTNAASSAFTVGKVYTVGVDGRGRYIHSNPHGRFSGGIRYTVTTSLFVPVKPQNEPFELTFNRPAVYNTQCEASFKDDRTQLFAEQLRHQHFMAVSRMFMGLPTVQLIHPRSL